MNLSLASLAAFLFAVLSLLISIILAWNDIVGTTSEIGEECWK
jgi:hypothetical protein